MIICLICPSELLKFSKSALVVTARAWAAEFDPHPRRWAEPGRYRVPKTSKSNGVSGRSERGGSVEAPSATGPNWNQLVRVIHPITEGLLFQRPGSRITAT